MPLQNRVDPLGEIHAVKSKGTLLGNRGILHNDNKEIVTAYKSKAWITCLLDFKGTKREIMSKGQYTELFFLDEATAFSAGHRPCAQCQRKRYNEFKNKWLKANGHKVNGQKTNIANIDKIIHQERIHKKQKITFIAQLNLLPDGTMIQINNAVYILWSGNLHKWTFDGYSLSDIRITKEEVNVITPQSYVKMFANNFIPEVHESIKKS